jgi:hypothetical protein
VSPHDAQTLHALTEIALWLIRVAAVAATLTPLLYATAPWRRSLIGWAFMTSSAGFALLLDLALLFRSWDGHLLAKAYVALGVYALLTLGAVLTLAAVSSIKWRAWRETPTARRRWFARD